LPRTPAARCRTILPWPFSTYTATSASRSAANSTLTLSPAMAAVGFLAKAGGVAGSADNAAAVSIRSSGRIWAAFISPSSYFAPLLAAGFLMPSSSFHPGFCPSPA